MRQNNENQYFLWQPRVAMENVPFLQKQNVNKDRSEVSHSTIDWAAP